MPALGELEQRVMDLLWRTPTPVTVRQVHDVIGAERKLAYTTVLTVLDRLAKKAIVRRTRAGRHWLYRPASTMPDLVATQLLQTLPDVPADRVACLIELVGRLPAAERSALAAALQTVLPGPLGQPTQTSASTGPLN